MNFDEAAASLAARVRSTGRGFLTMRRDELREAFGIGRFTEAQSSAVCEALARSGVWVHPHPFLSGPTLRLYDQKHTISSIAEAVMRPDAIPETPLRRAAELIARENAGRDLRSDDAPWIVVFDILLQTVLGRELSDWEELRDDRHPSELARELGVALGLPPGITDQPGTLRIAAAVCSFRPKRRRWFPSELTSPRALESNILAFIGNLESADRRLAEDHDRLLRQAARLLLGTDEIPTKAVEVGVLGLRFRREEGGRNSW